MANCMNDDYYFKLYQKEHARRLKAERQRNEFKTMLDRFLVATDYHAMEANICDCRLDTVRLLENNKEQ